MAISSPGSRPNGHEAPLLGVELVARNLKAFSVTDPPITAAVRLPEFDDSKVMAWPVPQVPMAVHVPRGHGWRRPASRRELVGT